MCSVPGSYRNQLAEQTKERVRCAGCTLAEVRLQFLWVKQLHMLHMGVKMTEFCLSINTVSCNTPRTP